MSSSSPNNVLAFSAQKMLYESVQRFSIVNLNDLIRVLMENIDDSLFDLSDKAKSDRDRSMYFDAMREIRLKRDKIKTRFNQELEQKFNQLLQNKVTLKTHTDFNELSLLDQEELEDSLAIDNMVSKARPHFEDELLAITERLKTILKRKSVTDDDNPLDPKSICDSFHKASEILAFDIQVKLIFYKLFDKFVMANLGHFYTELNDFFIKKGVLVDFSAEEERAHQTTQFMANRIRTNTSTPTESQQNHNALPQQNTPLQTNTLTAPDGSLLALLQQIITPAAQPGTPNQADRMTNINALSSEGNGQTIQATALTGSAPAAQNPLYLSALTQLQNTADNISIDTDPDTLKAHLQQKIATFKHDNNQDSHAADNQIIDIVSMIFDFFFEDHALPNPIKVLIGRLQIPILKVAIIDQSFFNTKKHPARQLLDSISKEALGWNHKAQSEQILITKVADIVENLLLDFDQDIHVFEQALNDFHAFIALQNDSRHKTTESIIHAEKASDEKIIRAQNLAHNIISTHISKHEFSFDVIDFLESIWKSVLYHTCLTQGEQSPHWKNIQRITSTLIWTLIVKQSDDEKKKLFKTLPALLRSLSKGMDLINIDDDTKNAVFQMLVKEHSKIVKLSNKNIVTRIDDQTVWPEKNTEETFAHFNKTYNKDQALDFNLAELDKDTDDENSVNRINQADSQEVIHNLEEFTASIANGDIQLDEEIIMDSSPLPEDIEANTEHDDFLETAQSLALDTWVEFNEINTETIQGKLSWKSNVTGKLVFVNRHGEKIKKISQYALAIELRSGNAHIMPSASIFDRALTSLMKTIKR